MLKGLFKKKDKPESGGSDRGLLVFENTTAVIRAETVLKEQGWPIRVMGPPPEIRTGCDLVIEFPLIDELAMIRKLSETNIETLQVVQVNSVMLELV